MEDKTTPEKWLLYLCLQSAYVMVAGGWLAGCRIRVCEERARGLMSYIEEGLMSVVIALINVFAFCLHT